MIYLVATADRTACKIGTTDNLQARLSALRNGNHQDLDVIATRDGGHGLEKSIHASLRECRLRGEWFKFDDDVLDRFNTITATCPSKDLPLNESKGITAILSIRTTLGLTQSELADRLGLNQSTISRMERGELETDKRTMLAAQTLLPKRRGA